jgi:hypothetical protein
MRFQWLTGIPRRLRAGVFYLVSDKNDPGSVQAYLTAPNLAKIRYLDSPVAYIRQTPNHALTNTTNWQPMFDRVGNNELYLDEGYYEYTCRLRMTGMSATSGNIGFNVSAITATLANSPRFSFGHEGGVNAARAVSGIIANTPADDTSNVVLADIAATLNVFFTGSLVVSVAGTVCPRVALTTAIATAEVVTGSDFTLRRCSSFESSIVGDWR